MQVDILKKKREINTCFLIILLRKQYADVGDGIKNEIKAINDGEESHYVKDYINIKFNSDNDLPLNKPLKFHAMIIIIRSVFEEVVNFIQKFF